jgi:hypothetical protein
MKVEESIVKCPEKICRLSDQNLILNLKSLVQKERGITLEILIHLKEIDNRKLFLELGYSSLWSYCTEALGYAEGSAQRRIEAMRAIREMPVLKEKIEAGKLSITNVAKVQSAFRRNQGKGHFKYPNIDRKMDSNLQPKLDQNIDLKLDVFSKLENKSQRQADILLTEVFPEAICGREKLRPIGKNLFELKIVISSELRDKLERVKSEMSHRFPHATWSEIFNAMSDIVIEKKKNSLPPLRRQVWKKAQGRCEYLDKQSGRRCDGHYKLEVEHVIPKAFGGGDKIENLRLFCRAHNVLVANQATLM